MLPHMHGLEDAYVTIVTLHDLAANRKLTAKELKDIGETGSLTIKVTLTTDAESVYKSLTSRDMKVPTEKTLLGHVAWVRELVISGVVATIAWCDTRDMTADGHTKGSIPRELLLRSMSGALKFSRAIKTHTPTRVKPTQF